MIEVGPQDRVLHLGIGDGATTRELARRAGAGLVLGVDPSQDAIQLARRLSVQIENLMFVLGLPEQIPWREDYFSAVLCSGPVTDWGRAATEIWRVMIAGGRAYFPEAPLGSEAALGAAGFEIRRGSVLEAWKPYTRKS